MPVIEGTVVREGQPLGGAYVRAYGPSGEFVAEIYTKDDGRFTFHVTDGEWGIEASAARAQPTRTTLRVDGDAAPVTIELTPA